MGTTMKAKATVTVEDRLRLVTAVVKSWSRSQRGRDRLDLLTVDDRAAVEGGRLMVMAGRRQVAAVAADLEAAAAKAAAKEGLTMSTPNMDGYHRDKAYEDRPAKVGRTPGAGADEQAIRAHIKAVLAGKVPEVKPGRGGAYSVSAAGRDYQVKNTGKACWSLYNVCWGQAVEDPVIEAKGTAALAGLVTYGGRDYDARFRAHLDERVTGDLDAEGHKLPGVSADLAARAIAALDQRTADRQAAADAKANKAAARTKGKATKAAATKKAPAKKAAAPAKRAAAGKGKATTGRAATAKRTATKKAAAKKAAPAARRRRRATPARAAA